MEKNKKKLKIEIVDVQTLTNAGWPLLVKENDFTYHESLGPFVRVTQRNKDGENPGLTYIYVLAYFEKGRIENKNSLQEPIVEVKDNDTAIITLLPKESQKNDTGKVLNAIVLCVSENNGDISKFDVEVDFKLTSNEPKRGTLAATPRGN